MKIDDIDIFKDSFVRVRTDAGITGCAWSKRNPAEYIQQARDALLDKDPFALESHLQNGLLQWAPVEHALWDVVGRAAGLPVHKLLGGDKERLEVYLTCVWTGKDDQSDIPPQQIADQAVAYMELGFKLMKIRSWRSDPMEDVACVKAVKNAVGDRLQIMVDRTASSPGLVWDYDTAHRVACELEQAGCSWLEEPFARDDIHESARLSAAMEMPITGGEGNNGLSMFREFLVHDSYDILQPDIFTSGGILTIKKIAAMIEGFGKRCILHGSNVFGLAPGLQITAALPNTDLMEICKIEPPLTPEEHWEEANRMIADPPLFTINDGYINVPQKPGLGFDLLDIE